jgi:hypothetical protein
VDKIHARPSDLISNFGLPILVGLLKQIFGEIFTLYDRICNLSCRGRSSHLPEHVENRKDVASELGTLGHVGDFGSF